MCRAMSRTRRNAFRVRPPRGEQLGAGRDRARMEARRIGAVLLLGVLVLGLHRAPAQAVCVAVIDSPIDQTHPALEGRSGPPCGDNPVDATNQKDWHGTAVASVITQHSRSADVGSIPWDWETRTDWYGRNARCRREQPGECGTAIEWIEQYLNEYGELWSRFPIVNASVAMHVYEAKQVSEQQRLTEQFDWIVDRIRQTKPDLWDRYTQRKREADDRSIYVRSAGQRYLYEVKNGEELETEHRTALIDRALVMNHPELWGHTLIVTAIDSQTRELAEDLSDDCGSLPTGWDEKKHGRHFCVAASGMHKVALAGGGFAEAKGTSFAAPYVTAILAELYHRCGFGGSRLVRLLLKHADSSGLYNNSEKYGAGVINREQALQACP